ncbi:MAG TPA: hypothetical protein VNC39_16750 [Acidocella sp.]|jgi:hypothetical protein|uniref:hypothetical protein n=1 Tax=Acidocella sp. TaxID=50710 RepID=UPI002C6745EF|nr:hypothetical protein [Acidocella sp.]HVE23619.1 hypothetical protein [Acidocella sp.]
MHVEEFRGLWTRSLIAWPDGRRDVTTQVAWLQGEGLFADLRQAPDLAARLSAAACRDELTAEDCLALAAQHGFSGRFEARDGAYEWVRRVDYQPPQPTRDIGRLFWRDRILVEEGVESAYTEHWHPDEAVSDQPVAGLWLRDAVQGVSGCLLRVGDWFAYVRGRREAIAGESLERLVQGADSLRRMQMLVDCEISLGRVGVRGWKIARSSLPYRVGALLAVCPAGESHLALCDLDENGRVLQRVWEIAEEEGMGSTFFEADPAKISGAKPW